MAITPNSTSRTGWSKQWPLLLVLVAPFIAIAIVWNSLPAQIPVHFDLHGTVDRYGGRWELLILPGINILLAIVLYYVPKLDPKQENVAKSLPAFRWIRLGIASFFTYIFALMLAKACNPNFPDTPLIAIGLLALFFGLGFLMPKLRQNYIIGIRLPWTLESEENWNRTHAFAGPLWKWGSVIGIGLVLVFPSAGLFIAMGTLMVLAVWTCVYSYRLFKEEGGDH